MFGIDAPELLVIAVVALVVIGPKELPNLLRTVGKWVASMRVMAAEFRGHVDDMVRQSELDELKKSVESIKENTVLDLQALDPTTEIRDAISAGEADAQKLTSEIKDAFSGDTAAVTSGSDALPSDAPAPQQLGAPADQTVASPDIEPLPAAATATAAPAPEPERLGVAQTADTLPAAASAVDEPAGLPSSVPDQPTPAVTLVADSPASPAPSPVATIPPADAAEPKKSAA